MTEDADLGLRLARFGYGIGILPSSTQEEAPARIDAWLRQRRRWSKGWMQTFITLTRDPRRVAGEVGAVNSLALALTMTSLVIAPPLWPFFTALIVHDLWAGLPSPASALELIEDGALDIGGAVWNSVDPMARVAWHAAAQTARSLAFLAIAPLYYLLTSAAAWMAIYDLILRPYHWHKTEHGLAKTSRQAMPALAARAAAVRAALVRGSGIFLAAR